LKTKQLYARTYFIIGIIIGLAFAILYNYKNKATDTELTLSSSNQPYTSKIELTTSTQEQSIPQEKKVEIKTYPKKSIIKPSIENKDIDTLGKVKNSDTIIIADTINETSDTITQDSIYSTINDEENWDSTIIIENDSLEYALLKIDTQASEINISQDELIYSSLMYPEGEKNHWVCSTKSEYDSVLVNNVVRSINDGLYVEFWRSPINSTGYKLTNNTLVLYGIYEYKKIKLKYTEDGYIELKYKNNDLLLHCNDNFTALRIVK